MWKPVLSRYGALAFATVLVFLTFRYLKPFSEGGARYPPSLTIPPQGAQTNGPSTQWQGWDKIDYLFAFGDSYSATAYSPNGTRPNEDNPFGNPQWPLVDSEDRQTLGPVWLHYLATLYNQSQVFTYSFASGGAVVDNDIITTIFPQVYYLRKQVHNIFLAQYADTTPYRSYNSLFTVTCGINDVLGGMVQKGDVPFVPIFLSYRRQLDTLYSHGARNFLLFNLPPADVHQQLPQETLELKQEIISNIAEWDHWLRNMRDTFVAENRDATVFLFDMNQFYKDIRDNVQMMEQTAGIKEVQELCFVYTLGANDQQFKADACKYKMNEYFWINSMHPTSTIHNATAARVVQDCFGPLRRGYCS